MDFRWFTGIGPFSRRDYRKPITIKAGAAVQLLHPTGERYTYQLEHYLSHEHNT